MSHTVLIVDDSAPIRRMVRLYIERNADWKVCGEAENGEVAIERVRQLRPDVVILDLQMPVMNGLEAARQITRIAPAPTMLMFTLHDSPQLMAEARAAGIRNVLSKSDSLQEHLMAALQDACARN